MTHSKIAKAKVTTLPADTCIVCNKSKVELEGNRITSCPEVGIYLVNINREAPPEVLLVTRERAKGLREKSNTIVVWGGFWDQHTMARAVKIVENGQRPWICQKCSGHGLCRVCGAPLVAAPGSDHITDDGTILHSPLLGVTPPCSVDSSHDQKI